LNHTNSEGARTLDRYGPSAEANIRNGRGRGNVGGMHARFGDKEMRIIFTK
jgi:hypothetical protein